MEDDAIRVLLTRLGRADPSGGRVIERAAILAEGTDAAAVIEWILAHGGKPQAKVETAARGGLHGPRLHATDRPDGRPPARFVLPAGALD